MILCSKNVSLGLVCLLCACSVIPMKRTESLVAEQQRVAEKLITYIIEGNYYDAYLLFSFTVTQKYPLALMQAIQTKINSRLGKPVSYTFKGQAPVDPEVVRVMQNASTSYLYHVIFSKDNQDKTVPMLITFDGGEYATKLLSHRFLVEEQGVGKKQDSQ